YNNAGVKASEKTVPLSANSQFDVIVNDMEGFAVDSYGLIKVSFTGSLRGRMFYYRTSAAGQGYDYSYGISLEDANTGTTAVSFNTFQPATNLSDVRNQVANWLSVVNLSNKKQ